MENLWRSQIRFAFCRDLNTLKAQTHSKGNRAINLLPYLRALTVEQYADIVVQEIRLLAEGSETFSYTVGQLYKQLGTKVQARFVENFSDCVLSFSDCVLISFEDFIWITKNTMAF